MRYYFALVLISTSMLTWAEVQQPQPSQPGGYYPPQQPPTGSNQIQVFDNNFFAPKPSEANPTMKGGRYVGKDAEVNTEITERITEECRSDMERGMKAFRTCFDRKKKDEIQKMRVGREDVEKRQQMPLSNVPPVVDDFKRPPSSEE